MTRNEIREKIIKRRNIINAILSIILLPILLPLGLIYKIGELAEKIADLIQNPFITWRNKMIENYKNKELLQVCNNSFCCILHKG